MSTEEHAQLKRVFEEVASLPPGAAREARLDELCAGDAALRARAEELLRFDAEDDGLLPGAVLRSDLDALWDLEDGLLEDEHATVPARYEIVRPLGQGGFGTVYLAREKEPIPRLVAIKVIKPGMDTREVLLRFDSERRALATMDHPGIARVFAAGADQRGRPYFVMEYVEGQEITAFCDERRMDIRARLELFIEVCQAIQHAHYKGIVHRDVKPANVIVTLIDGRPSPKVIDFGIAKAIDQDADGSATLTHEGQLVGTPLAMSPEQARGGGTEVDTRTDVYALGGLAYELLSGAPPFRMAGNATDLARLRQQILNEDPPRPSARVPRDAGGLAALAASRGLDARTLARELSADLDWIVMKALAKDPARRYSSPSELAQDVRRYLASEPVTARPPSRSYQVAMFARRHRASLATASIMLTLLVAGSIGTAVGWRRSVRSLALARQQETLALEALERARSAEAEAQRQAERAREEAGRVLAVNSFLNDDLLSAVSPEAMGFDVRMRQVIDVAASKVADRFPRSPRLEREIRTTLGRTYRALSLHEQAEEQLLAALATWPDSAGPVDLERDPEGVDARARASIQFELARIRLHQNRNFEAETSLRALLEEYAPVLGEDDPLMIDALHFLGVSLGEQEHFDEASAIFDQARTAALDAVGADHELAIQALHSQGLVRVNRAQALGLNVDGEVVQILEQACDASRTLHGPDDPRSLRRLIDLAAVLAAQGQTARSRALFEEAYERSRRIQGPDHPTTAIALLGIGKGHLDLGSPDLAQAALEEALAIATGLGENHPILLRVRFDLALCRMAQGRLDEAEELLLLALETAEREKLPTTALGAHLPELALLLAEVCRRGGRGDEAAQWREVARELAGKH